MQDFMLQLTFVGKHPNLELVQLNSFWLWCRMHFTTDQVEEILSSFGKMYTLIKIDEINNLGAVRIRIRSLLASMNKTCFTIKNYKQGDEITNNIKRNLYQRHEKDYTILIPQMAPIHFDLIESAVLHLVIVWNS